MDFWLKLILQFCFPKSTTLSNTEHLICTFQDQLSPKLTTITNRTATGKSDIVCGRSEKHSCCWQSLAIVRNTAAFGSLWPWWETQLLLALNLIIALLWMKESDSLFLIILSTNIAVAIEKLEDEYKNLQNLEPYLTLPRAIGGLFTPSEMAPHSRGINWSNDNNSKQ